jgi:Zn-dependent protease
MDIDIIFRIAILIMSVVIHEVAHGAMAYYFGDPTAKNLGRLTLNPIKHLDPFGSVILPVLLAMTGSGFIVGWAKPVPYNPYNLRNRRVGEIAVALAGVVTNFIIALVFALLLRFGAPLGLPESAITMIGYIVMINLVLFVFNLVPIPPLDGSKILLAFFPYRYERVAAAIESYGIWALLIFIIFFSWIVSYVVEWLFWLLV